MAMKARWRWPPESVLTCAFALSSSPTVFRASAKSARSRSVGPSDLADRTLAEPYCPR
jgi:hypothetical protein